MLHSYLEENYITKTQLDVALKIVNTSHHSVDDIVLACAFATSKEVALIKAQRLQIKYVDLTKHTPEVEALRLIPRAKAIEYSILPLMIKDSNLIVCIDERADFRYQDYLERTSNMSVKFVISTKHAILNQLMTHSHFIDHDETLKKINKIKSTSKKDADIISLVDLLIEDAIEDRASDIHISPEKDILNVFFRVDGVLIHQHALPIEFQKMIVSRIKVLSNLDISQTGLPQDGQMEYRYLYADFRLRISSITTANGEKIVMRLLSNDATDLDIDSLGLSNKNETTLKELISQPNGLLLVTGPTGSGKTTTLYSLLKEIDSLKKNILTVENPIEYQIPFINQTQINKKTGYGFDTAIRAFMRQDPDVILLGEIRDKDTADAALSASMTGHLVLATLHTNDAVEAISRLADLGIEKYLLGAAILAICAQRLVRRLCPHCKVEVPNQEAEIQKWEVPKSLTDQYKEFKIYEPQGCPKCSDIGYSSREVIIEILIVDQHVEDMILKSQGSLEILQYARSKGMLSMLEDGYSRVLDGSTSFEEISSMVLDKKFLS